MTSVEPEAVLADTAGVKKECIDENAELDEKAGADIKGCAGKVNAEAAAEAEAEAEAVADVDLDKAEGAETEVAKETTGVGSEVDAGADSRRGRRASCRFWSASGRLVPMVGLRINPRAWSLARGHE